MYEQHPLEAELNANLPHRFGALHSGRRKALLVGINYRGTTSELRGCINDVNNMHRFLLERGFLDSPETMLLLKDDEYDQSKSPTRANMLAGMKWLVSNAAPGDSLFFHYSGHGGQVADEDGDEDDGMDETILPVDFNTAGQITDDLMHDVMVKPLPPGCRLTAIFDSCHSGTALDLPYIYDTSGQIEGPHTTTRIGRMYEQGAGTDALNLGLSIMSGNIVGTIQSGIHLFHGFKQSKMKKKLPTQGVLASKTAPGDVVMFSGCRDDQTSMDAKIGGEATGAMSFAFQKAVHEYGHTTSYQEMLKHMRATMKGQFKQVVQLSSSHPMDMHQQFAI